MMTPREVWVKFNLYEPSLEAFETALTRSPVKCKIEDSPFILGNVWLIAENVPAGRRVLGVFKTIAAARVAQLVVESLTP